MVFSLYHFYIKKGERETKKEVKEEGIFFAGLVWAMQSLALRNNPQKKPPTNHLPEQNHLNAFSLIITNYKTPWFSIVGPREQMTQKMVPKPPNYTHRI